MAFTPLDLTEPRDRLFIQRVGGQSVDRFGWQRNDATFDQCLDGAMHDVTRIIRGSEGQVLLA